MEASMQSTAAGWLDKMAAPCVAQRRALLLCVAILSMAACGSGDRTESVTAPGKTHSVFFSDQQRRIAQENIHRHKWAADFRDLLVAAAKPWATYSDDEL